MFSEFIKNAFPSVVWRREEIDKLYKTANFTVLNGTSKITPKYNAALIEFLFMDNPNDRSLLEDTNILERYIDALYGAILQLIEIYGYKKE